MSFRDYLHEKAEESRHNETSAYMMFLAGTVFLVGGILETLSLGETPSWFLIIPYFMNTNAGAFLGLTLTIGGLMLILFGIATGLHYSHDRGWYMQELRKAGAVEEGFTQEKRAKSTRKPKNGKLRSTCVS